jgi:hypothetical protein
MADVKVVIEPLNDENYLSWSQNMQMFLITRDLWDVVESSISSGERESKASLKARAIIGLHVGNQHKGAVMAAKSAAEAWQFLHEVYQGNSAARVMQLHQAVNSLKMTPEESVVNYVSRARALWHDLKGTGDSMRECDVAFRVVAGLPREWSELVTSLTAGKTRESFPSLSALLPELQTFGARKKMQGEIETAENPGEAVVAAYSARMRDRQRGVNGHTGEQQKRPRGPCYSCGREGHIARDCRNKPSRMNRECFACGKTGHIAAECRDRGEPNRASSRAFVSRDAVAFTSRMSDEEITEGAWLIDSGATSHMTGDRSQFRHFKPWIGEKKFVRCADGDHLEVKGVGSVQLECQIPGNTVYVGLHEILYVEGLQTNLLSVGKATERGVEVKFATRTCQLYMEGKLIMEADRNPYGMYEVRVKPSGVTQRVSETDCEVKTDLREVIKSNRRRQRANRDERKPQQPARALSVKDRLGDQPSAAGRKRKESPSCENLHKSRIQPRRNATPRRGQFWGSGEPDPDTLTKAWWIVQKKNREKERDDADRCDSPKWRFRTVSKDGMLIGLQRINK